MEQPAGEPAGRAMVTVEYRAQAGNAADLLAALDDAQYCRPVICASAGSVRRLASAKRYRIMIWSADGAAGSVWR